MHFNPNQNIPFYQNMESHSKEAKTQLDLYPSDFNISLEKKESPLPKPDFSPLTKKDWSYTLKSHGSYKKPQMIYPESPMKSPIKKFYTPSKIEGRNLFGTETHKPFIENPFRKWNFDSNEQQPVISKNKLSDFLDNVEEREEDSLHSPESKRESENILYKDMNFNSAFDFLNQPHSPKNNTNPKNYHMDQDFTIIKTISDTKYDCIYKCIHNSSGNIYAVKKINKSSYKSNYNISHQLYTDLSGTTNSVARGFCIKYYDFWTEEETYDLVENSTHFTEKNWYWLYDYYKHGDWLDYLAKLEQINYTFTPDFYWDVIFEMLCGTHYFHEWGYLHLDIKPANFWVDDNGIVMLSDFGLCHHKNELSTLNDIIEGDSTYISPEWFNRKSFKDINEKCDTYSLGLSILEIWARVELPKNGPLWRELRVSNNYNMPKEFWVNWNISDISVFLNWIGKLIAPYEFRSGIQEVILSNEFPDLNKRYQLLMDNRYTKSVWIPSTEETGNLSNNKNRPWNVQCFSKDYGFDEDADMCVDSPR